MFKKVSFLAFVVLMLLVFAPNTLAQPNKPDGFCNGGVGWPYVAGEDSQDPGCGAGRFIVHFDAGGYQGEEYAYNWPHAEWLLEGHARNGTYWFEPASWYANDYVNAPVGFCNGGVPWKLGITHRPLNPYCGPGQYIIHYDAGGSQGENIQASWEGAELTRWGQQRTLWYEPTLIYQDAPAGFCNGGTPWNLPSNSIPNNPNCPVGRYLVDYDGFSDFRYDWGSAVSTLGYRAGTFWYEPESWYAGTPIPPTQAPLPACPAGYGSRTRILPGNYDPGVLTQDERQDLFELFGNSGTAPVGYGGQRCLGGHEIGQPKTYAPLDPTPVPPACPAGVGEPGSFHPESLTQQQRNELYWAFGHNGEAPVGYGGETCYGGTMTLPSFNPQPTSVPPTTTPVPTQSGGGNPSPTPTDTPVSQPQPTSLPSCHPTNGCIQFTTGSEDDENNRWWPDAVYRETAENKVCTDPSDLDTVLEFNLDYGAWATYDLNSFRLYAVYLTAPINEMFNGNQAEVRPSTGGERLRVCVPHQLNGNNFYIWSTEG